MKFPELRNIMSGMKTHRMSLIPKLDFEEGEISEFEAVALETIQNETYAYHTIQKSRS